MKPAPSCYLRECETSEGLGVDQLLEDPLAICANTVDAKTLVPELSPLASKEICPVRPLYEIPATASRTAARVTVLPAEITFLIAVISIFAAS